MKSIPALSFKRIRIKRNTQRVCAYSFRFGQIMFTWKPHASLRFHFGQNDRYRIHTVSPQFMWTQVKIWLRFSTEIKSHTSLSSFRLSCESTPNRIKTAINKLIFQNLPKNLNSWYCTFDKAGFSLSKKIVLFT